MNGRNRYFPLVAAAVAAALAAPAAIAQDQEEEELGAVVVTGTRVANRSALETAVAVDVVSAETLQNAGITELNQALSVALPSFNFPRPGLADGTDTIRPATLRGLAPDPAHRWPSVDALRKALVSGRRRGRQRRLLIATGAALTIAGMWFGLGELDRRTARSACRKEGERFVEGLTGELARAELHRAITAVEVSHTADTANRVVPMLDAYATPNRTSSSPSTAL